MKGIRKYRKSIFNEPFQIIWKKRPSELKGFQRTMYLNVENGDYLRIDYNLDEKKVRLLVEDSEEGGTPYYAVISDGRITIERNANTGRRTNVFEKIRERSHLFSTVPNRRVIKLINRNYGIGVDKEKAEEKRIKRREELETVRKRYFKPEDLAVGESQSLDARVRRTGISDFIDIILGVLVCIAVYIYERSFIVVGIVSAIVGIIMGIIDIFFRDKEPLLFKVLIFIVAGLGLYIFGYYIF